MSRLVPWRHAGLLLVLAASACGGDPIEPPTRTGPEAAWERVALVEKRLAADVAAAPIHPLEALQAIARDRGLPLPFFAGPGAEASAKYATEIHYNHPCGPSLTAVLTRIPRLGDPLLQADRIVELGPNDAIAREWSAPIDAVVVGVRGDRLLVRDDVYFEGGASFAFALEIAPDGGYAVVPLPGGKPTAIECPARSPFGDSAYDACWSFLDLDSGAQRRLTYQGRCT
ncbi:MAG: hypothetical protein WEF50_11350 [Myxococcota bacterium]